MAQAIPCSPCSVVKGNSTERLDILKLQYLDFTMKKNQAIPETKQFPPQDLRAKSVRSMIQKLKSKDPKSKLTKVQCISFRSGKNSH